MQATALLLVVAFGCATAYYFPNGPPHRRQVEPQPRDEDKPVAIPVMKDGQLIQLPAYRQAQPEPRDGDFKPEPRDGDFKPEPRDGDFKPEPRDGDFKPEPRGLTMVPLTRGNAQTRQSSSAGCQMSYSMQSGQSAVLQSPNYPNEYPDNVQSTICFSSPSGTSMSVSCDDFNLESSSTCAYDWLGLGLSGRADSLQKYCGRGQPQSPSSSSNSLVVQFRSDHSNPGAGTRSPYRFRCTIRVSGSGGGTGTSTTSTTTTTTTAAPPSGGGANSTSCSCGQRNDRIVGGADSRPNEFPWRCYLKTNRYSFFCGCSIISNRWILTAAHCTRAVMPLQSGDTLYAVLGDHVRSTSTDAASQQIAIGSVFDHPNYNPNTMDYDYSLLKMASVVTYTHTISPVCLPWKYENDEFAGTTVVASGWGTTSQGGSTSDTLKQVNLPVLTTQQCSQHYPGQITERMICTYQTGKDTCQGDSGGSIDLLRNNRYYNIGVVSWGIGCAKENQPGVYAKTTKVLGWIRSTTSDTFCQA